MSASTITTRLRPGEAVFQEAAASRVAMMEQRREGVEGIVDRKLAEFGRRGTEVSRKACEMEARFEAFGDAAPASVREETRSLIERGAPLEELAPQIERLEDEAGRRHEQREVSRLSVEGVAEQFGGDAGDITARSSYSDFVFQFDDGHRMKAEVSEAELGAPLEILWHARESDIPGCEMQLDAVRRVAARTGMEVVGEAADEGGETQPSARQAGGEVG
jgi:hypothetical protein